MSAQLGWLLVALFAAVLAGLAATDPLWKHDWGMRLVAFGAWAAMPIGVYLAGDYIDGENAVTRDALVAALPWILLATWGRPALLMRDAWPEEASSDSKLVRMSNLRTAVLIAGIFLGAAVAAALALAGIW